MSLFSKSRCVILGLFCTAFCSGVVEQKTIEYPRQLGRIHGTVTGYGAINPGVQIRVFDNGQVWLDDSLSPQEKRQKQTKIAEQETNARGHFDFRRVPDGFYEVEFSRAGWNVLSLLVRVRHGAANEKVCVELRIESAAGKDSASKCP